MAIRMSGMISGMDTESLVQSLVEAQKTKNKKTTDKKTKLEWTQEKWKELNTKLYKLYSEQAGKLMLKSSYGTKKVSCTDESKVKVSANSNAPLGSQSLQIERLAASGYLTGAEISTTDGGKVTSSTKLSELGITKSTSLTLTTDGKTNTIDVTADTTIDQLMASIQKLGVNASLDATNQRIFISSKKSGKDADFSLIATSDAGNTVLEKLGLKTGSLSAADKESYALWGEAAGLVKNDDGTYSDNKPTPTEGTAEYDGYVEGILSTIKADGSKWKEYYETELASRITAYTEEKNTLESKNAELTEANQDKKAANVELQAKYDAKISVYTDVLDDINNEAAFDEVRAAEGFAALTDEEQEYKLMEKAHAILQEQVAASAPEDEDYAELTQRVADMSEVMAARKSITANKATIAKNKTTIAENTVRIKEIAAKLDADNASVVEEVDAAMVERAIYAKTAITTTGAKKIDGVDAKFTLNGVDFESASNETTVNGVTLTLTGTTTDTEEIHFTVTNDTDAVYNTIKEFVKEYNSILEEMNTLYYADSARDYAPLSNEEREAMSEEEIEKWETKIKDSLLRRDSTLGGILTAMKSSVLKTVAIDGQNYSLSSFGVGTSSAYTEKGKLHIKGDADDDTYSDQNNLLKSALESDPDKVMQVFTGVMKDLYETLKGKMSKVPNVSSAMTFYNDITLKNQLIDLNKQIAKDEEKLTDLEDKYYKQFAAMETALAKLQSQESAISGFFQ